MKSEPKFALTPAEEQLFCRLKTPAMIQDYLETLPMNFGDTAYSPRLVIQKQKTHCLEGALLAAAILWYHGKEPLLLDLKSARNDQDHVVALFRYRNAFGALSKTNHAVLRYREPVYRTIRELALSYFHEYFLDSGKKTLLSYSTPLNMRRFGADWVTTNRSIFFVSRALDAQPHRPIASKEIRRRFRLAEPIEREAGKIIQYKPAFPHLRTLL